MFGLIAGLSAMFVTGACIGVGMTALCNASGTLDNMEENWNMKKMQDILIEKLTDTATIPTKEVVKRQELIYMPILTKKSALNRTRQKRLELELQ